MKATTLSILALADALGIREQLLEDLRELVAEKVYFSPEKVAERYEVSLSAVKKWRADGLLIPSFKVSGGTCRYNPERPHRF